MMTRNTPSETSGLFENNAAMMTVQRITEVINRRKKTRALEGGVAGGSRFGHSRESNRRGAGCQFSIGG